MVRDNSFIVFVNLLPYFRGIAKMLQFSKVELPFLTKLDLESIGSSLGFEGELIWAGLDWRGPDIRSGLVNRHLIIEGHRELRRS